MELSPGLQRLTVFAAVAAWFFAGVQMALVPITAVPSIVSLHAPSVLSKTVVAEWFAWQTATFLLGGAIGGILFGWLGDKIGRTRTLALAILVYSGGSLWGPWIGSDRELLAMRFLIGMGMGGTWPCAVALLSEAWPETSRPVLAGAMGTAANVGIFCVGMIGRGFPITASNWRTAMLLGGIPVLLSAVVAVLIPESPRWLAQSREKKDKKPTAPLRELFQPPLLGRTILGILLGMIPLLGAWSAGKWLIPWAESVDTNGGLKGDTQAVWALGAVLGSALGGWLANRWGRRFTYFVISVGSLALNFGLFWLLTPQSGAFLPTAFLLGFVATIYFGWLPLYLPELFPTAVRASGSGISYNFGRFGSAAGVFAAGKMMSYFHGDYSRVGMITSLIYALGMVVICFAPDVRALRD